MSNNEESGMAENSNFRVFVNPLAFSNIEGVLLQTDDCSRDPCATIGLLCAPDTDKSLPALVERYRRISTEPHPLFIAPLQDEILQKLIWPLRNAKASFVIGNFIGTISQCGIVGEMAAILFFETAEIKINGSELNESMQKKLFGRDFERLGQERRIEVLSSFGVLDAETKSAFETIRNRRNRYLHFFSTSHTKIESDAVEVYHAAVTSVVSLIGQDFRDGKLVLRPAMYRYLQRHGLIHSQ